MLSLFKTFISGFADLLKSVITLFQFLINTVSSLLRFFSHLPSYLAFTVSSLNMLPAIIIPFAIAAVSIYFVLRLINRQVG